MSDWKNSCNPAKRHCLIEVQKEVNLAERKNKQTHEHHVLNDSFWVVLELQLGECSIPFLKGLIAYEIHLLFAVGLT